MGTEIQIEGGSVCLHSDTGNASQIVAAVRRALEEAGYTIAAPSL
jgi:lactam utilization protein B